MKNQSKTFYRIYGKDETMTRFKALDLSEGCFVENLIYASFLDNKQEALDYCSELNEMNKTMTFEVRKA